MAQFFVDTGIFIQHHRQSSPTIFELSVATYGVPLASAIVVHEFESGEQFANRTTRFSDIFKDVDIVPFDDDCALYSGQLEAYLRRHNLLIGLGDILIAATAIYHELPLLTPNRRHFERVPDLQLLDIPDR